MPPSLLVVACGNPLRGDDGFGWHVARSLEAAQLEWVEVMPCHQLTPELALTLSVVPRVAFVDVSLELPEGELRVYPIAPQAANLAFTHQLEPAQLLGLTQSLYGYAPEATIIAVGARAFEYTEQLSAPLQSAVSKAEAAIKRLL